MHSHSLLDHVAMQLVDRVRDVKRDFTSVLSLGRYAHALERCDGCPRLRAHGGLAVLPSDHAVLFDEEHLPFRPHSFDLIMSCLSLHWVNDLPGTLVQIRRSLQPDSLFLAATLGARTLHHLRQRLIQSETDLCGAVSPRVCPFPTAQVLSELMQRVGFALPVVDTEPIDIPYPNDRALFQDLKAMGETNALHARRKTFSHPQLFQHASALRQHETVTVEVLYLHGWSSPETKPAS